MYYHASPIKGITRLEPRVSNHGIPLIYFSKKRENVLVYLSNAIEKYCRDTGFSYDGKWEKWGPYGFDKDGRQRLEEYYPNALKNTYKGVSGYIYRAESIIASGFELQIPDAAASSEPVIVADAEFIPDAYEAILQAERDGLITILRYEDMPEAMKEWNERTIKEEYEKAVDHPEYRHFLRGNFPDVIKDLGIMDYRKIEPYHIHQLWELQKAYKAEIGEDEPGEQECARLAAAIEKGHITFYGAWDQEALIGCCSITVGFSTFDFAPSGVFEDFYICPEFRHKGIARKLVQYAYQESGISSMTVGCADCDVQMYQTLGFSIPLGNLLAFES